MSNNETDMKNMVSMIKGRLGGMESDQDFWGEFMDDSFHTNLKRGQEVAATRSISGIYITLSFGVKHPTPEVEFYGSAHSVGACKPDSVFSISTRYGGGMNQFSCAVDVNEVGRFARCMQPFCEKILAGRRAGSGTADINGAYSKLRARRVGRDRPSDLCRRARDRGWHHRRLAFGRAGVCAGRGQFDRAVGAAFARRCDETCQSCDAVDEGVSGLIEISCAARNNICH